MVVIEHAHRGEEFGKNLVGGDVPGDHIPVVFEDAAPVLAQLAVVVVGGLDNLFGYALDVFTGYVARIQLVEGEFALKIDEVCGVAVFARKFEEGFHVAQQHVHIVDKYGVAVPHILFHTVVHPADSLRFGTGVLR